MSRLLVVFAADGLEWGEVVQILVYAFGNWLEQGSDLIVWAHLISNQL
jgi:hypothetical protein